MAKNLVEIADEAVLSKVSSDEGKYLSAIGAYSSASYDCTSCNDEGCNTCVGGGGGPGPE